MDLALSLPTKARSWEVVKRAEELGYTHAWFYDTELLNAEVFVAMGAAAMKTSRIKLCAGVLIPSNRIAPVAASGLASLNALAPGRIVFGASTGFTARRTLGLGPVKLARLEKYVEVVEGLLQGKDRRVVRGGWSEQDTVPQSRARTDQHQGSHPDVSFGLRSQGPAADGKAGCRMDRKRELSRAREGRPRRHARGLAGHGRDTKDLYAVAGTGGCVLDEGEPADSPRAKAQAGPYAAIVFHNLVEQDQFGSIFPVGPHFPFQAQLDAYRKVYERYQPADARYLSNHRGHLMFVRPEETHITGDIIKRTHSHWHSGGAGRAAEGNEAAWLQPNSIPHRPRT